MTTIADILETIKGYSPDAEIATVMQAYLLAARAHAGQTRKSGEAYLNHPLAVANILAELQMDVDTIATALLHDALEDNPITKREMTEEMGPVITNLVDGVTKIGKLKYRSKEELQAENFRKMMLAMSRDLRVILVKLADRLHNMRTLEGHRPDKRKQISRETLEVYAPIAHRLGILSIKNELEDLCFQNLMQEEWSSIVDYLERTQADRQVYTERVTAALASLFDQHDIDCKVTGRAKHTYSIYRKMVKRGMRVEEVPDLLAFRVILDDVGDCYAALGHLHAVYPPVPERIKDFIARPKPNGYQSLHTTVEGPDGKRVEIQLRTTEMHRVAERGIAAHWRYKQGHLALTPDDVLKILRIRDLFETANEAEDATEFMETVKVELYADEVFVFTPGGDIKRLRRGATPLDFAYAIHTDVGHTCVGAKVNGRMVTLRSELRSGDTVEVLTSPKQCPSRDWLQIAKTGRAVAKIRRFLRQEERERGAAMGREMLEAELRRFESSLPKVSECPPLQEYIAKRNYRDIEPLLVDIARGTASLPEVCRVILPAGVYVSRQEEQEKRQGFNLFNRFVRKVTSPVLITGEDGVLVNYAGCCSPLPGEAIIGYITRGRGITVHRANCEQLTELDAGRHIEVQWDQATESRHCCLIDVYCANRPGLLAKISTVCESANVNIQRAEAKPIDNEHGVVTLQLSVRDRAELGRVIKSVARISGVVDVERV